MVQMTNAATNQAVEIAKGKLREFLENNETARQAIGMPGRQDTGISMDTLDSRGKRQQQSRPDDDDDI